MYTDTENKWFLKAVESFRKRFIVISPEFRILAANDRLDGDSKNGIIGNYCHDMFYDRSSPCENCAVKEAMEQGRPVLKPKPDDSLDLSRMPCYFSYPIYSKDKIEAFVSMDFDLPTRSGLEDKFQQSNVLLRNLLFSALDGVIAADKKGKLFIFNEAAAEVFGYSVEEALLDVNIRDIYPDQKELEVMRMLRSEKYGGKGKLKSYQVDVLNKNGELVPINLNAAIIYDQGREMATIGFFHDLREKLQMEKELEKTQLQLLQAEKRSSLGKLAAGVAHQLNNPLGGITLFTKLILEEYDLKEEGIKEDLHRILKDAQRCRDTVKELLEFTRQTRHLMRPHDINKAIDRTLFLLEDQTLFHNIKIEKDLSPSLPLVPADIQQLNHLLMNIILNAAQAMAGRGKLTVKSYRLSNGKRVCIEISDTGPGIPNDILPHIFDPFFTTKEEGQGTGLGLSLAYNIVENHGGNVSAGNNPEKGATFIIELPVARKDAGGDESGE